MNPLRLSISESAKFFGLSDKTIRNAVKNKELKYIVIQGRFKINFESLLAWAQSSSRKSNKLQKDGVGMFVKEWNPPNDQ